MVRRWNSATHTFFFAWSEAIVTLEDVEKILLLPLVGCKWPRPLLEHLQTKHNDFIGQLTIGSVVGNPLLRILVAVLIDMQETQVNALTEERLFKWRDVVRDLHKAGLEVSFVLHHF